MFYAQSYFYLFVPVAKAQLVCSELMTIIISNLTLVIVSVVQDIILTIVSLSCIFNIKDSILSGILR